MATTQQAQVDMSFRAIISGSFGSLSPQIVLSQSFANGVVINSIDQTYVKERSVASGVPDDIDLIGGGLVSADGTAFGPVKMAVIAVKNLSTTSGEIITVGGSSNTFTSWLTGTNAGVKVNPGGMLLLSDPSLAGYALAAGSTDTLRITSASGTISYLLGLAGRSS